MAASPSGWWEGFPGPLLPLANLWPQSPPAGRVLGGAWEARGG